MTGTPTSATASVEAVRRFYEAAGDRAVIDQAMSPDVVWDITPGFLRGGIYEGLDAVLDFLRANAQEFVQLAARPEKFFADGAGHVTVLGHYAVEAEDDRSAPVRFHHLWTLADGRIVRLDQSADSLVLDRLHRRE